MTHTFRRLDGLPPYVFASAKSLAPSQSRSLAVASVVAPPAVTRTDVVRGASSSVVNHGPRTIPKSRSFGGARAGARSLATGETATTASSPTSAASPASSAIVASGAEIKAPGPTSAAGFANSNPPSSSKILIDGGTAMGDSRRTSESG